MALQILDQSDSEFYYYTKRNTVCTNRHDTAVVMHAPVFVRIPSSLSYELIPIETNETTVVGIKFATCAEHNLSKSN